MRVIGGTARSIRLKYPKGVRIRPTTDQVRESLFSSLGDLVAGAQFADLYAGTGAVGIEALSRGAGRVVFIERNTACVEAIKANLANTKLQDRAVILRGSVNACWKRAWKEYGQFDIVFVDPPYGLQGFEQVVTRLVEGGEGIKAGGMVIVQHEATAQLPVCCKPQRVYRYGQTMLSLFVIGRQAGENGYE